MKAKVSESSVSRKGPTPFFKRVNVAGVRRHGDYPPRSGME
jgi:hypothetical protein